MKKFAEYNKFNLSEINKDVLSRWNSELLFERSMKEREGCPTFVFYEVCLRQTVCPAYTM